MIACLDACPHCARAAENTLGVSVGADLGSATVRQDRQAAAGNISLAHGALGSVVLLGLRPLRHLGVTIDDFEIGQAHLGVHPGRGARQPGIAPAGLPQCRCRVRSQRPATGAWAGCLCPGGHCPSARALGRPHAHRSDLTFCAPLRGSTSSSPSGGDFASGLGTPWKFGLIAVHRKYDRTVAKRSIGGGDSDTFAAVVSWALPGGAIVAQRCRGAREFGRRRIPTRLPLRKFLAAVAASAPKCQTTVRVKEGGGSTLRA